MPIKVIYTSVVAHRNKRSQRHICWGNIHKDDINVQKWVYLCLLYIPLQYIDVSRCSIQQTIQLNVHHSRNDFLIFFFFLFWREWIHKTFTTLHKQCISLFKLLRFLRGESSTISNARTFWCAFDDFMVFDFFSTKKTNKSHAHGMSWHNAHCKTKWTTLLRSCWVTNYNNKNIAIFIQNTVNWMSIVFWFSCQTQYYIIF